MLSLFAQTSTPAEAGTWVSFITSGGFGLLVWYLIAKHLPKLQQDHKEQQIAAQDAFLRSLDKEREQRSAERSDYMLRLKAQHEECAAERKEMMAEVWRWRQPLSDLSKQVARLADREEAKDKPT